MRRNDQHDAFINAVTHELKTPIASIRLYLRDAAGARRRRSAAQGVLQGHAVGRRTAAAHGRAGAEGRRGGAPAPAPGAPRPGRRGGARGRVRRDRAAASPPVGRARHARDTRRRSRGDGGRRRRRVAHGALEPDRQRREVLAATTCRSPSKWPHQRPTVCGCACAIAASASRPRSSSASSTASTGSRRAVTSVQGHRPRPLHRALDRASSTAAASFAESEGEARAPRSR